MAFFQVDGWFVSAGGDKHRLPSQVVRPPAPSDDDHKREAAPPRGERSRGGERRGDQLPDTQLDSRGRGREQRETTPPPPCSAPPSAEDRDGANFPSHEDGKKKVKSQRKGLKKGRKDDEVGGGKNPSAATVDRFNPEPPADVPADVPPPSHPSPKKGAKKKVLDRKRKRSRGESDVSEEETVAAYPPHGKRKRGPRTPPPSARPGHRGVEHPPLSKMDNFSDWSDEDVSDRSVQPEPDRAPAPPEPLRRSVGQRAGNRERCNPPPIAPLLLQEPPMLLQTLPPQPLMSQPLIRKPPPEQGRGGAMGGNQSRVAARRMRSPSNESAHRDEPQGPRSRRGRLQGANSRDRERERDRERTAASDGPGAERKSRIDQLRRAEPSRSTSSGTSPYGEGPCLTHVGCDVGCWCKSRRNSTTSPMAVFCHMTFPVTLTRPIIDPELRVLCRPPGLPQPQLQTKLPRLGAPGAVPCRLLR